MAENSWYEEITSLSPYVLALALNCDVWYSDASAHPATVPASFVVLNYHFSVYRGWTELKSVRWHRLWSVHTCGTYTSQVFIVISGLVWTRLTRHWWTVYTACDDRQNFAVARHDAAATAATAHAPSNGNWNVYYTWLRHIRVGRGSLFKTQLSVFAPNPNHGSYYLNLIKPADDRRKLTKLINN